MTGDTVCRNRGISSPFGRLLSARSHRSFRGLTQGTTMDGRQRRIVWSSFFLLSLVSLDFFAGCRGPATGGREAGRPEIGSRLPSLLQEMQMRNAPVDVAPPKGGWVIYVFSPGSAESARNNGSVEALAGALPADWILLSVPTGTREVPAFL